MDYDRVLLPLDVLAPGTGAHEAVDGLRPTIDGAPIGLAQFDVGGRFLYVNDRLCTILGYSRAELLACTFQEITFPEDLPHCLAFRVRLRSAV